VSKPEQIREETEDQVDGEPSNDLDVSEKKSEVAKEVKSGLRVKEIQRDPTVAGQ
jgi:hypothetical protein